ncbi:MAG TPA: NADAR family protein, partial [Agitococcus sp.]|nr:NADAR family protein [Agitococcus sp.]
CQTPAEAKKLGRAVKNFNAEQWQQHSFDIVVQGNIAKFSQNVQLKDFLLTTGQRVLVEASPLDTIWGIGLGQDNPKAQHPQKWHGENLLGFALMMTKEQIVRLPQ